MWLFKKFYFKERYKQKYLLKRYGRAYSTVMNFTFTTASTDFPSQWNKVPSQTLTGFYSQCWSLTRAWITRYTSFQIYFLKIKFQVFCDLGNKVRHFASQNSNTGRTQVRTCDTQERTCMCTFQYSVFCFKKEQSELSMTCIWVIWKTSTEQKPRSKVQWSCSFHCNLQQPEEILQ